MIIESIVTTVAVDGTVNCAPMGVEWGDDRIVLKPFLDTATYRNVLAVRTAVVNLVDDVRIFARAAISNPAYPTVPATIVRGVRLADCCSWRELEVREIDSTPPRARLETGVVHRGVLRQFITSEFERLQVIVEKTAGPHEQEAMALLTAFVRDAAAPARTEPSPA
jgi:hypothetical protein